jgi:hypothetical protein
MAWPRRPLTAKKAEIAPVLAGIDVNTTRVRAVQGPARAEPQAVPLEDAREELPMVLSLEGRHPAVGRAGAALCRQSPHLACLDFLAHLGESREWVAGRHRIDPLKAMALVLERLQPVCAEVRGLVLVLPPYLARSQVQLLAPLISKARLPLLGSVRAPLVQALAAYSTAPWTGPALIVDVDDHALTGSTVVADGEQLWIQSAQVWPVLNARAWKMRLLNQVADRCIRQSRRDPRDCASAEQSLYEQIDDALDRVGSGKTVELLIQTSNWFQNLLLRSEELVAFCSGLVRESLNLIPTVLGQSTPAVVLVSAAAARLPGLTGALEGSSPQMALPVQDEVQDTDFGEDLIEGRIEQPSGARVLAPDAAARAAHALAARCHQGELPRSHLDLSLPLAGRDGSEPRRNFRLFGGDAER